MKLQTTTVVVSIASWCLALGACQRTSHWTEDAAPDADTGAPDADGDVDADADGDARPDADEDDGSPDGDVDDDGSPLVPEPYRPCEVGTCWDTSASLSRCRATTIDEDFSSGRYNVHDYATTLFVDGDTTIGVVRTGGSWQPVIVVAEADGTVLSDGVVGLVRPGLEVTIELDGDTGDEARVRIRTDRDLGISLFVTGWSVVDSGFESFLPTDATYTLTVAHSCDDPPVDCVVNSHTVAEPACGWLNHIGRVVVAQLEGTRDERLDDAAVVAWWSLKEGVLYLENPIVYSNCNFTTGDDRIGPLDLCPSGRAWQVGLAAVQVPNYTLSAVEATTSRLFPGQSIEEVLEATAIEAGLDAGSVAAVVASTGDLRKSWLLRTSAVGFTHQVGTVVGECIEDSRSWCFGSGWDTSRWFAADRDAAMTSIEDIRAIFDALAP